MGEKTRTERESQLSVTGGPCPWTEWTRALNYSTSQPLFPLQGVEMDRDTSNGDEGRGPPTPFSIGFWDSHPQPLPIADSRPSLARMGWHDGHDPRPRPCVDKHPIRDQFIFLVVDIVPRTRPNIFSSNHLCRRRVRRAATACLTFRVIVSIRATPCDAVNPWPRPRQTSTPSTGRPRLSIPRPLFDQTTRPFPESQTLAEGNRLLQLVTCDPPAQVAPSHTGSIRLPAPGSPLFLDTPPPPPPPERPAREPTTRLVLIIKNHLSRPWTSHNNSFGLSDQGWLATRLAPVPTSLPTTSPPAPIQGPPFRFHPLTNLPSPGCLFGDGPPPPWLPARTEQCPTGFVPQPNKHTGSGLAAPPRPPCCGISSTRFAGMSSLPLPSPCAPEHPY